MSDYTKGPWGIMKGDHGQIIFSGECGRGVAMLARQVTTSERDANAMLISAAPELLEALEDTQGLLERLGMESSDEYQANVTAITKAKGEQS